MVLSRQYFHYRDEKTKILRKYGNSDKLRQLLEFLLPYYRVFRTGLFSILAFYLICAFQFDPETYGV